MIHFSLDFSVTPFMVKSASETLVRTFDMFALSELCGLREGLFITKCFLAPLPHFCSAPACSQLRPGRDLPSLPSFSRPMEGWSQSPLPVVTGFCDTALPIASKFDICHLHTSWVRQRLMRTKHGMVLLLALQGRPPSLLTPGISLPKPEKYFPKSVQTAPKFAS